MRRARWRQEIEENREADAILARRARCPKTVAMEERFRDALGRWPRHHRIEMALVALGFDLDAGRQLLPEEEAHFEKILADVEADLSAGVPA